MTSTSSRAAHILKKITMTARAIAGVGDYQTYIQHRAAAHPGEPLLSREDYFKNRQTSRYGASDGKISRCC